MPEEKQEKPAVTVNSAARKRLFVWLGSIATIGAALVAINTFTGLNFRPAWGYEIEQRVAAEAEIQQRLQRVLEIQDTTSRSIVDLKKGQLELRIGQIDRKKREIRRELAGHQTRAQDDYRSKGLAVPGWLLDSIADAESTIKELDGERDLVERQILELTQ